MEKVTRISIIYPVGTDVIFVNPFLIKTVEEVGAKVVFQEIKNRMVTLHLEEHIDLEAAAMLYHLLEKHYYIMAFSYDPCRNLINGHAPYVRYVLGF